MPVIQIDDIQYEVDEFDDVQKKHLQMILVCDAQIKDLRSRLAITQTARTAYVSALKKELLRN